MGNCEWVLDELPSMGALLLKAALKRGKKMEVGSTLPNLKVRCDGLRFQSADLDRYCGVVGAEKNDFMPLVAPHILAAPLHLFLLVQKSSPLRAMGLIHVRNTVTVHECIPRDSPLDIEVELIESRWVQKGLEADVKTLVMVDGKVVWEEISVVFSRQPGASDLSRPERLEPHESLEESGEHWALPRSAGRRYAGVSGDYNPIHLYGWSAKLFGFPAPIIHGMWSFARCMSEFPSAPCTLEVSFQRPVMLPAKPVFRLSSKDGGTSHFALVRAKDGKAHLVGKYTNGSSETSTGKESS